MNNILLFIDWFVPAYKAGGPIQSAHNIVQQLGSAFNFYIVTSNSDIDGVLNLPNTALNKWTKKEDYTIIYLDEAHQNKAMYRQLYEERDYAAVYFNSLFSKNFTLLPLRLLRKENTPLILAPRGMLGKGALSIKPFKKKIFLQVVRLAGWHNKVIWHATASKEKNDIQKAFGNQLVIHEIPNLAKKAEKEFTEKKKEVNILQLFFLSRISSIKNLLGALNALAQVAATHPIHFTIIGPIEEPTYWEACSKVIEQLPQHIEVAFIGAQPPHKLQEVLAEQHVLLLPREFRSRDCRILAERLSGHSLRPNPVARLRKRPIRRGLALNQRKSIYPIHRALRRHEPRRI